MASQLGRELLLKISDDNSPETFTTVAGLTNVTFSTTNGTLDETSFDDAGIRKLKAGKFGLAKSVSGSAIFQDDSTFTSLQADVDSGARNNYQIVLPGSTANGTWSGAFICTTIEVTGETDGNITYSITLESAGAITFA